MPFFRKYKRKNSTSSSSRSKSQADSIQPFLNENIAEIRHLFQQAPDLVIRELIINHTNHHAALVYLEGLTDIKAINDNVLAPLLFQERAEDQDQNPIVPLGNVKTTNTWEEIEETILQGSSVLFMEGKTKAFIFSTSSFPQRAIADSQIEPSLKGAHQGFIESSSQNISMLRRYVANQQFKIKELSVGQRSKTKVVITYLEDVAHPEVLQEIEDRIKRLDVDTIINTGILAEYIEDNPYSPFPQILMTERPDFAAFQILEGRIVIVVDKSPSVLVCPAPFISFFETIDDYCSRWMVASFIRLIRYFAFFIAIFVPAIYIAVITFHPEIIPIKLLITLGTSRENVPFPPIVEALLMELTIEMLRESGIRLPAPVGQTVGVVGGIVIGQAAVQAGFVSNVMVIAVSLTAIASYIMANYDLGSAIRLIRFPMMVLAALFGFLGLSIGLMILIAHFITLESLGTPYGSPLAPLKLSDFKNVFIRLPVWSRNMRPESARAIQSKKASPNQPEGDHS